VARPLHTRRGGGESQTLLQVRALLWLAHEAAGDAVGAMCAADVVGKRPAKGAPAGPCILCCTTAGRCSRFPSTTVHTASQQSPAAYLSLPGPDCRFYAINRHKATTLTPSYHAGEWLAHAVFAATASCVSAMLCTLISPPSCDVFVINTHRFTTPSPWLPVLTTDALPHGLAPPLVQRATLQTTTVLTIASSCTISGGIGCREVARTAAWRGSQ
jgi:hypothetical protein